MSDSTEERAMATVRKAEEMIADVKRKLEEGEDYLRKLGVDPEKVRQFSRTSASAEDQRKAQEQVSKDLEEIEDEVRQARMQQGGQESGGKMKRPRTVV
jgi:predicted phage gp36 major capsid-like protein